METSLVAVDHLLNLLTAHTLIYLLPTSHVVVSPLLSGSASVDRTPSTRDFAALNTTKRQ